MNQDSAATRAGESVSASTDAGEEGGRICPYLGRRQHPDVAHPFATSRNVCFASPRGNGRPYSQAAKSTQVARCLQQGGQWRLCRHYRRAVDGSIAAPRDVSDPDGHMVRVRTRKGIWRRCRQLGEHLLAKVEVVFLLLAVCGLLGLMAFLAFWATNRF